MHYSEEYVLRLLCCCAGWRYVLEHYRVSYTENSAKQVYVAERKSACT
jgi:hypothetical protein